MIELINTKKNILRGKLKLEDLKFQEKDKLYDFLRYLVHNIGGNEFHDRSINISTTESKVTARKFACDRNNSNRYVIVSKKNCGRSQLSAEELKIKLNEFGFQWYEDIHNEVMQGDAISTFDILGIEVVDEKNL